MTTQKQQKELMSETGKPAELSGFMLLFFKLMHLSAKPAMQKVFPAVAGVTA